MSDEGIVGSASIYRKLALVYEEVKYIQKDKKNTFHGYSYASEAAIKDHLHDAFAKHGLVMLPPDVISIEDVQKTSDKGKTETVTTIHMRLGVADPETGESVTGTIFGRGVDNADKGPYKAITGGLKYFLTTLFLIPTGDDPEQQQPPEPKKVKVVERPAVATPAPRPAVAAPSNSPLEVEAMLLRMKDKYSALGEFSRMKKELIGMLGSEGEMRYYDMLAVHNVKKSDEFKTLGDSKRAAKAMQESLLKIDPLGVNESDIPEYSNAN
jgi:hypothetical protein